MKRLIYIPVILGLALQLSCDSMLDVRPEGEVVNNELFKTEQGFEDAIYGVYSTLAGPSFYGKNLGYYFLDVLGQYFYHDYPGDVTVKIANFNYKDAQVRPLVDGIWEGMYKCISYVNNILGNLEGRSRNTLPLYDVYRSECLALRAFMHFEVLRLFSENIINNPAAPGIPYVDRYTLEVSPFLSAEEVYDRIIADLQEAERLMQAYAENVSGTAAQEDGFLADRVIHMNVYAIQGILARVYWMKGELDKAAGYARKVVESGKFSLEGKVGMEDLVNGVLSPKETVWGLFSQTFFNNVRSDLYITGNPNCLYLKPEHEDEYQIDKEGTDFRYEKWFRDFSSVEANGLRCIKILDSYELLLHKRDERRIKGINMIRLPELYYIITEYYLSEGNVGEAERYFDKVLESRGLLGFSQRSGSGLNVENVIRERKKEFICEGQYFFTLKRYNKDVRESFSGKLYQASNGIYVLPIPDNELEYRY